jgi:hypothetical protein
MPKQVKLTCNKIIGNDENAINRHSIRQYEDKNGNIYIIRRTLDVLPSSFEMYKIPAEKVNVVHFPKAIKMAASSWKWAKKELSIIYDLDGVV